MKSGKRRVEVRPVRDTDRAEWLRMRQAFWGGPVEMHRAEMAEQMARPDQLQVLVAAREEGGLGGFLEASIRRYAEGCETSPVGYIEGWYVDPDLRRTGAGRALVAAAEAWATSLGCREMASDCSVDNQTSFKAHLALGYAERETLIHFSKRL